MKCRAIQRRLAAYVGDELSPQKARAVDEHLQRCETCRREHESFTRALSALRRAGEPPTDDDPPPKAVWRGVRRRMRERAKRRERLPVAILWRPVPVPAAVVTAFLAVLAVTLGLLLRPLDTTMRPVPEIVRATRGATDHVRSAVLGPSRSYRPARPSPYMIENVPAAEAYDGRSTHHLVGISQQDEKPGQEFILEQVTHEPGARRRMQF